MIAHEMKAHLEQVIIPFWKGMRDDEFGGYYGLLDFDLNLDKKAVKGCILHSRILWFFSNAYMTLKDPSLLEEAKHAFEFIKKYCIDYEKGGVFWSVTYDGKPADTMKHTYNQAFCIYALSSYFDASNDPESLQLAWEIYRIIEERCTDELGYLEAFTRDFLPESNEKLSENGVMAEKTMNTLLHVFEAYTELYRVTADDRIADRLRFIMDVIADKIYNPELNRQEVFFDKYYNSLIDLHSYGHDIETAWLTDRGCEVLNDPAYTEKMSKVTKALTKRIYDRAYVDHSLLNECERGVDNTKRIWWVQAEAVVGFYNGWQKDPSKNEYLEAAMDIWEYIKKYVVDTREGSEWFATVLEDHTPVSKDPIVEPWKCPYHNGRMCIEIIRRNRE